MTSTENGQKTQPCLVDRLRAVEAYDARVASRIAEFNAEMRGEEWMPGYCALGDYVSRGQLPKVDVVKAQRTLIECTAVDNTLLRKVISGNELIVASLDRAFDRFRANYKNPKKNPTVQEWFREISELIGELPRSLDKHFIDGLKIAGITFSTTALCSIPYFIDGILVAIPFGSLIGLGIGSLGRYAERSVNKSELGSAYARLLPNAQYLDGKIEEFSGGAR